MGYRSEVYLKTTTEGWIVIKQYNDKIEPAEDRPLRYAEVNKTESGFYRIEFHDIKWYDSYKEVQHFNTAMELLKEQDIPYSFIRLGEDTEDIEHVCNWTDDIPDEINSFEPVVDISDDDYSCYESVALDAD